MGKKGCKRESAPEDPVRSNFDFDSRVRRGREKIMKKKYERAEKLTREELALSCEAVEALRGDADWLTEIIPYLGTMPDSWMVKYLGVSLSVIRKLRERNVIDRYSKDKELEKAMCQLEEGEPGLAEEFRNVDLAKIACLFGIEFSQSAQSADAV